MSTITDTVSAADLETLRSEVRAFVADETGAQRITPRCDSWMAGYDPEFSSRLGERGWLGMTLPARYGGHDRSPLERYVVIEELLAAGAPVAFHWLADRQVGPMVVRFGTEEQRETYLPGIAAGTIGFAAGMSEPDSGSDLASVRTTAVRDGDTWILNGTKVWTSHAHRCRYMMALCRTSPAEGNRHVGLSQMIVDLTLPGIDVRPIRLMNGAHHFNEVVLRDVRVPAAALLGQEGEGWKQITAELALERSGPERFLSTIPLAEQIPRAARGERTAEVIGALAADLATLRRMSFGVAATLAGGRDPDIVLAAFVKDLGPTFERDVIEAARTVAPPTKWSDEMRAHYERALVHSPGFSLRGGTTEILHGIIARGLGVR